MKAYKIDVTKREVKVIEVKNLMDVIRGIGDGCEYYVCPIKFKNGDIVFVDDQALLKSNLDGCFMIKGIENILVGNAVVVGTNDSNDLVDVSTKYDYLDIKMLWGDKEMAYKYRAMLEPNIKAIFLN